MIDTTYWLTWLLLATPPLVREEPLQLPKFLDLGNIYAGPTRQVSISYTHRGSMGRIQIDAVRTGCHCAQPTVTVSELQPNQSGILHFQLRTMSQPEGGGTWPVQVTYRWIQPSGEQRFQTTVIVRANLIREICLEPNALLLSSADSTTAEVTLRDRREQPLRILRFHSSSPHLQAELSARAKPGEQIFRVQTLGQPANSQEDALLLIETDDANYPRLELPVRMVNPPSRIWKLYPEQLILRGRRGTAISGLVQLRCDKPMETELDRWECDLASLQVTWSKGSQQSMTVRVRLTPDAPEEGKTVVRLFFRDPQAEPIEIPIEWIFR